MSRFSGNFLSLRKMHGKFYSLKFSVSKYYSFLKRKHFQNPAVSRNPWEQSRVARYIFQEPDLEINSQFETDSTFSGFWHMSSSKASARNSKIWWLSNASRDAKIPESSRKFPRSVRRHRTSREFRKRALFRIDVIPRVYLGDSLIISF